MSDIVKRLRYRYPQVDIDTDRPSAAWEAADEIERLRAALETIENAPEGPNLAGSIQAMRDKARRALERK